MGQEQLQQSGGTKGTKVAVPEEVLMHIFSYLPALRDFGNVQKVNWTWKKVGSDNTLWSDVFCRLNAIPSETEGIWKRVVEYTERLKQEVLCLQQRERELQSALDSMTKCFTLSEKGRKMLEVEFDDMIYRLTGVEKDMMARDEMFEAQQKEMYSMKRELNSMKSKLGNYERKLEEEKEHGEEMKRKLKDITNTLEEERARSTKLCDDVTKANKSMKRELSWAKEMADAESARVVALKTEKRKLKTELEKAEQTVRDKLFEMKRLEERLNSLSTEEKYKRTSLEQRITSLTQQLKDDTDSLSKELERRTKKEENLKRQLDAETNKVLQLERRVKDVERDLKKTSTKYETEITRMKALLSTRTKLIPSAMSCDIRTAVMASLWRGGQ